MGQELSNEGTDFYNWRHPNGPQQPRLELKGTAEKTGAFLAAGGMILMPFAGDADVLLLAEKWGSGTFETVADSLAYHFEQHGAEVGAENLTQYLRKADGFASRLRGARRIALPDGAIRYVKDGKYVIKSAEGKILSFGRVR